MECPLCHRTKIGQIGMHRYYCSDCYIEFESHNEEGIKIYDIMDDGTLKVREFETLAVEME